jgi:amidohydrolase
MSDASPSADSLATLAEEARDLQTDAVTLRRDLHRWPEQGNDNPVTRDRILEALEPLGLAVTLHETTSGIGALLTGGRPGPTVLLRADTDALPMPEDTGLEFASKVDNTMHACGHDTHVAMLSGAARLLAARRQDLAGRVLFMFQPGEEGHHGARFMLDEGLLEVAPLADGTPSPITAAFALHTTSALNTGFVSSRPGPIMASDDVLVISVTGRGGHASEPHRALDPIPIACEIVQALQTMVTRRIDVFDPAVITVGRISAGTAHNVIPETAEILGTIRTVGERTRAKVHDGIRRVADGIAAAHEASASVEIRSGYPVTVNGADEATFALDVARRVAGSDRTVVLPNPVMGAEDFSYVLQRVPGAMLFLGATPLDKSAATAAPNHSNKVYFDEAAMVTGMALYAALALEHLGSR